MPKDVSEMTTIELLDNLVAGNGFSAALRLSWVNELQLRVVSATDPDVAMRGGVHPTRPNP